MTTPATEADLLVFLDAHGVCWTRHAHAPVFTVDDARSLRGDLPGGHTKNLFLREKSGAFWLVVCLEDRRIRIRDLERALGVKQMSFASAEALRATIGVEPGSVTPFALVNDRATAVRVALDTTMMAAPLLNFHPLRNDATLAVSNDGLVRFLAATGHAATWVDFDGLEALAAKRAASATG